MKLVFEIFDEVTGCFSRRVKLHSVGDYFIESKSKKLSILQALPDQFILRLKTVYRLILLLVSCGLMSATVWSQELIVPHRHYTPHDGLPGIVNQQAMEDSRGYVWIASNEGIAFFNGYEFKMIEDHPGFSTEFIHFIEEDRDGRMMFLSETNLTIYDGREFLSLPLPGRSSRGVILVPDDEKSPVVATGSLTSLQVFEVDQDSLSEMEPIRANRGDRVRLKEGEKMISVYEDRYYFLTENNTAKYQLFNRLEVLPTNLPELTFFPEIGFVMYRHLDPPYDYFTYNRSSREFIEIPSVGEFYEEYRDRYTLHRNPPGKNGEYLYLSERQSHMPAFDLQGHFIWSAFKDRSGQLWTLTDNGLYKFFLNGIFQLESEPASTIWGVSEWVDRLFFHSYLDGLFYREEGEWKNIPNPHSNGELFPGRAVSSNSHHFVPAWDGIFVVDKDFETHFLETDRFAEGLYFDSLTNELIAADENNLYVFDADNLDRIAYFPLPAEATRVGIFSIRQSGDDLWLAGPGGVMRFNREVEIFDTFTHSGGELPCKSAVNIFIDEWGEIWVSGNCGLMWWNAAKGQFELMEGFAKNTSLVDMIELGEGKYLVSGSTGLFAIEILRDNNPSHLRILKEFNQYNGFDGIKPFLTGFFRDSRDQIWIPAATGTYMVDERMLNLESSEAELKLTSIDDCRFPFNQEKDTVYKLPYGKNFVDVGFDMVSFNWPGNPGFQYRLAESDEWSLAQRDQLIRLIELDHGTHELTIRAVFKDRDEEYWPYLTARVKVQLPVWRRSWFPLFAGGFVLFSALVIAGSWLYNLRIRLNQFKLHNHLQLIQIHALEAQLDPHFIFNVLSNIQKKVVLEQPEEANNMIVKLGRLMRRYLESVETGIESSKDIHRTNLTNELELINLYLEFEMEKYPDKFTYQIDVAPNIDTDKTVILPMLIQPFVENSIKHGFSGIDRMGEIEVKLLRRNDSLIIEIKDNGVGRAAANRQKLERDDTPHRSKGTMLVKRRIELLQKLGYRVDLTIEDRSPGTLVRIISPVFEDGIKD